MFDIYPVRSNSYERIKNNPFLIIKYKIFQLNHLKDKGS